MVSKVILHQFWRVLKGFGAYKSKNDFENDCEPWGAMYISSIIAHWALVSKITKNSIFYDF